MWVKVLEYKVLYLTLRTVINLMDVDRQKCYTAMETESTFIDVILTFSKKTP